MIADEQKDWALSRQTKAALADTEDAAVAMVMQARRGQARLRLALAVAIVAGFGDMVGWPVAALWFGAYLGLQGIEAWLFPKSGAHDSGRPRAAVLLLAANPPVFASLAMLGPVLDGAWGVACAGLMLGGVMLNVVLTSRASRRAFLASAIPVMLMIAALPVMSFAVGGPLRNCIAIGAAGALMMYAAPALWRASFNAWRSEQAALAAKSAFMAVISHELRTPISAILAGAAEMEKSAEPGARAKARLIGQAGGMMRTLLNDLLDMAKLEAGRMSVEAIDFDLRALLADQMRFWRAEARKTGLRLRFSGCATTPRMVFGDPTRLRQILNNLISNALKFTPEGAVELRVEDRMAGQAHHLSFSVIDTGPGLTAHQAARLFTPFEQLDASVARNHGGTGLGLAISRDLARVMGGDLTVDSVSGQGATFTLTLALPQGADAAPAEPAAAAAAQGLSLLVVDDHEINRRAMCLILEPIGADLTTAASAAEALDLLAERRFDAVLMDCYMPGMDGRAATRLLRASQGPNRDVPVIAVTASAADEDIRECRAAGMTAHVAKPIDATALHRVLAEALETGHTPDVAKVA
jgi:signal transduction histidine kinase/ActR/RegA family two-component response regulator